MVYGVAPCDFASEYWKVKGRTGDGLDIDAVHERLRLQLDPIPLPRHMFITPSPVGFGDDIREPFKSQRNANLPPVRSVRRSASIQPGATMGKYRLPSGLALPVNFRFCASSRPPIPITGKGALGTDVAHSRNHNTALLPLSDSSSRRHSPVHSRSGIHRGAGFYQVRVKQ